MNFVNKKVVFLTLIFSLLANFVSYGETNVIIPKLEGPALFITGTEESLHSQIFSKPLGTFVIFGHYEQDANTLNGKEPVVWMLVENNTISRVATLMSVFLIDCFRFNGFSENVTWETSSLRSYMNTTMYDELFNEEEKRHIRLSHIENPINPYYGAFSGNPTDDYIYLPSIDDMLKYFGDNNRVGDSKLTELKYQNVSRMAMGTSYAMQRGLRTTSEHHKYPFMGNYFLRTVGNNGHRIWYGDVYADYYVSFVSEQGEVRPDGTGVDSMDDGIRPIIQVYY